MARETKIELKGLHKTREMSTTFVLHENDVAKHVQAQPSIAAAATAQLQATTGLSAKYEK